MLCTRCGTNNIEGGTICIGCGNNLSMSNPNPPFNNEVPNMNNGYVQNNFNNDPNNFNNQMPMQNYDMNNMSMQQGGYQMNNDQMQNFNNGMMNNNQMPNPNYGMPMQNQNFYNGNPYGNQPMNNSTPKTNNKNIIYIVIAIVAVLVVYFIFLNGKSLHCESTDGSSSYSDYEMKRIIDVKFGSDGKVKDITNKIIITFKDNATDEDKKEDLALLKEYCEDESSEDGKCTYKETKNGAEMTYKYDRSSYENEEQDIGKIKSSLESQDYTCKIK